MSKYVRTLLHEQAASVALRPPDFQAVRRAGDRRIRVRRAVSALAVAAAVALIGGTVVVLGRTSEPAPVLSLGRSDDVTWATGSTIHVGAETVDVGHTVWAYVRTGAGFATIDAAHDVYSVTAEGVTRIGHMAPPPVDSDEAHDEPRIVADPRGTLVGWVGEDPPGTLTLQTYDQANGELRSYPVPGATSAKDVVYSAIDGRKGYWRTPSGVYEVDLDSGDERLLVSSSSNFRGISSAAHGVLAFRRISPDGEVDAIFAGRSIDNAKEMVRQGDADYLTLVFPLIRLSPTGAWLSLSLHHLEEMADGGFRVTRTTVDVYHTSTGEHVTLDVTLDMPGDQAVAIPVVWLDAVTVQVAVVTGDLLLNSQPSSVNAAMYRCTVPNGSCRLAADLGTLDTGVSVLPVMPDGRGAL
jgi:hypothetical protein